MNTNKRLSKDIECSSSSRQAVLRTNTMRLLVAPQANIPALVKQFDSERCWPRILNLCESWRVLPTLAAQLAACRHALPPAEAARLRLAVVEQMVSSSRILRAAGAASQMLSDAGITAAAFKGVAVLTLLHGGGVGRSIGDIDLLIAPEDAARAISLLQAGGFQPKIGPIDPADYLAFLRDSPGSAGNEAISLVNQEGIDIDLHWKLGAFDTHCLLARSQQVAMAGGMLRVLSSVDCLCLTAHHAIRNDLVPDAIARDLIDAQGWFRLLGDPTFSEDAPVGIPEAIGTAHHILGQLVGAEPGLATPTPSTMAQRLSGLYFHQLTHEPINTDLSYVFSRRAAQQVLRGFLRSRRRYEELMHAFERVNGEASMSLRQRLLRLSTSLLKTQPARLWQIRTLSRLKEDIA
jgi:hypothetical protein